MRIDIREWQRRKLLREGQAGTWTWTITGTGERVGSIGYQVNGNGVALSYATNGRPTAQVIALQHTLCNYGGRRAWFTCPVGRERAAVLYFRAGRFACRRCQHVAYASQSEDVCGRTWIKQQKLEARLGGTRSRPRGMHAKTHERLLAKIFDCEDIRESALAGYLGRLMTRYPSLKDDLRSYA